MVDLEGVATNQRLPCGRREKAKKGSLIHKESLMSREEHVMALGAVLTSEGGRIGGESSTGC